MIRIHGCYEITSKFGTLPPKTSNQIKIWRARGIMPMDIESILRAKPEGDALAERLRGIRDLAEPLLSMIVKTFPEFTPHDILHSNNLLQRLNDIIDDTLKEALNAYEIYFLIASAYLHDIGMVDFPEFRSQIDKSNLKDFIRDNHHIRSKFYIEKYYEDLGLDDFHQAAIIGEICSGHRKENLFDEAKFDFNRTYKNKIINIPLLSAFLRTADELDLDFERTPKAIFDHLPPENLESMVEWEKHLSISGVAPSTEDPLRITANANCSDARIHRKLKELELKINNQLEELPYHLHQYRDYFGVIPRRFSISIKPRGYKSYDIRFTLNENKVIDLLLGELIYGNKFDSIRELLKNSIDACRLRYSKLAKEDVSLDLKIIFVYKTDESILTLSDNGVGMNDYIISNYLAKLGQSYYKSDEFTEEKYDFAPLSELGYGFLSYFMIAEKVKIETKAENSDSISVEINDPHNYFDIKNGNKSQIGTDITLYLKEDSRSLNLESIIKQYARHVDIPILLKIDENDIVIKSEPYLEIISIHDELISFGFQEEYISEFVKKYSIKTFKMCSDFFEGTLNLLLINEGRHGPVPICSNWFHIRIPDMALIKTLMYRSAFCYQGIVIKNYPNVLSWINKNFILFDLNLKKNLLDFNFSRDSIIENKKYCLFINELEETVIEILEKFLDGFSEEEPNYKTLCNQFFDNYIEIHISAWASKDEVETTYSTSFLNFIKKCYYFEGFTKKGFDYFDYEEVIRYGKPILISAESTLNNEQIADIIVNSTAFDDKSIYIKLGDIGTVSKNLHKYLFGVKERKHFDELWHQKKRI